MVVRQESRDCRLIDRLPVHGRSLTIRQSAYQTRFYWSYHKRSLPCRSLHISSRSTVEWYFINRRSAPNARNKSVLIDSAILQMPLDDHLIAASWLKCLDDVVYLRPLFDRRCNGKGTKRCRDRENGWLIRSVHCKSCCLSLSLSLSLILNRCVKSSLIGPSDGTQREFYWRIRRKKPEIQLKEHPVTTNTCLARYWCMTSRHSC